MFYKDFEAFDEAQANKTFKAGSKEVLQDLVSQLSRVNDWNSNNIHSVIELICEEKNIGFVMYAMRSLLQKGKLKSMMKCVRARNEKMS